MTHNNTQVRTSRWGTELVPYTSPRERAMASRFPVDYPCLLCNRRLVKPNTVCFSCYHLLVRVLKALAQKQERVTDEYVAQLHGRKILAKLEQHDKELRKQEFLERIDNPKEKPHVLEYKDTCARCYISMPIGLGYCEEHPYSVWIYTRKFSH